MKKSISISYKNYAGDEVASITEFCSWQGNLKHIVDENYKIEFLRNEGEDEIVCKTEISGNNYYISFVKTNHPKWKTAIQAHGYDFFKTEKLIKIMKKNLKSKTEFLAHDISEIIFEENDPNITVIVIPEKTLYIN